MISVDDMFGKIQDVVAKGDSEVRTPCAHSEKCMFFSCMPTYAGVKMNGCSHQEMCPFFEPKEIREQTMQGTKFINAVQRALGVEHMDELAEKLAPFYKEDI